MREDLWALWPDDYMVPLAEKGELEEALQTRSDDYLIVNVTAYDETSCPCEWTVVK